MTAEIFRKQILAVVEVWEDWIVFPPAFTKELRTRLDGASEADAIEVEMDVAKSTPDPSGPQAPAANKFKATSFQAVPEITPSFYEPATGDADDIDGAVMDDVDGEPMEGDDLDGIPLDNDALDGEPMDGEPMDGEPMNDDDVDGEPMAE